MDRVNMVYKMNASVVFVPTPPDADVIILAIIPSLSLVGVSWNKQPPLQAQETSLLANCKFWVIAVLVDGLALQT